MDPLRRNLDAEQPSGACPSDPPDAARGVYADYVERLEDQIAGRTAPSDARRPGAPTPPDSRLQPSPAE